MSVANIGSLLFIGCIKWLKYVIFSKPSVHILSCYIIGFHGNNGNITETNHTKNKAVKLLYLSVTALFLLYQIIS